MPLVTFLPHEKFCPEGLTVEVEPGTNILELAHDHHIEMESACGGVKACTTCHCIVRKGFDSLEEADELEEDMLRQRPGAWRLNRASAARWLSLTRTWSSRSPTYSLNHAAEAPH
ncbi:ferredoxin, 2Fe-2S type, ISC system [Pseudomonas putida S11]|nr:ferredoxin, 2Fe-2S type, ISC system [Pseudomonas putida S11]